MTAERTLKVVGDVCIVNGCERTDVKALGMCNRHYHYNHRHGHPEIKKAKHEVLPICERDAAWLAAVIDCEGWIGMFKSTRDNGVAYWAGVGVGNTNPILTTRLRQLTGLGRVHGVQQKDANAKYKYTWMVNRYEDVRVLLLTVLPHLLLKREQAYLILSLPPKNTKAVELKAQIKARLSVLNKKGVA